MENLLAYLKSHHKDDIIKIIKHDDKTKHFSININFMHLFEHDTSTADDILKRFELIVTQRSGYLHEIQREILSDLDERFIKENVHIRVYNLPTCSELTRVAFPDSEDLELFLQITGTVTKASVPKILEYQRAYKCSDCGNIVEVNADVYQKFLIRPPWRCENPDCKGNNFSGDSKLGTNTCKDYQEVKIQELISRARDGCMPNSMLVLLEDDLVDCCKPGDTITVCGVIKRQFKPLVVGKKIEVEIVIKANHVQVDNDTAALITVTPEIKQYFTSFWERYNNNPLKGRDVIVGSFCPHIYGLHLVKLAVLVTLAGGSRFEKKDDSGTKTRSEPHILLVGDPGTAKSQFLRAAAKIITRSVFTTGVGSTSAGLTVTAVREPNGWQLEAGALVLSDGGVCCIDEFTSMKEHDRTSIHEAMEQQTISVAKAGIVCKLNTRCSILAAANPKSAWDKKHPLTINIGLPTPLLSRFDLVFILRDIPDLEWDKVVADYILNDCTDFDSNNDNVWSLEMLQAYFVMIKNFNPSLTETSNKILAAYYQLQRKAESRNKARTTVRLLDSLIRLSQAHAKLMFHPEVEVMDTIMAIVLMEVSMQKECSVLSLDADIRSPSLGNPEEKYLELIKVVLGKLELIEIMNEELKGFRKRCLNRDDGVEDSSKGKLWNRLNSNFIKRKQSFTIVRRKVINEQIANSNQFESIFNNRNLSELSIFDIDSEAVHSTAITSSNCLKKPHDPLINQLQKSYEFISQNSSLENSQQNIENQTKTSSNFASTSKTSSQELTKNSNRFQFDDEDLYNKSLFNSDDEESNQTTESIPEVVSKKVVGDQQPQVASSVGKFLQKFKFVPHFDENVGKLEDEAKPEELKKPEEVVISQRAGCQRGMFETDEYDDLDLDI